jgi:hypothetical protein
MSTKILQYCCDEMHKMQCDALIQWKQKLSFMPEGVYFCPPQTTRYGSTAQRSGLALKRCPFCPELLPQNAEELEIFNDRMRMKHQELIIAQ